MAMRFNPATGKYEDDGRPAAGAVPGAAAGAPGMAVFTPPPPTSYKETDWQQTSKRKEKTAEEMMALGRRQNAIDEQKDAQRETAEAQAASADKAAEGFDSQAKILDNRNAALDEVNKRHDEEYKLRRAEADRLREEARGSKLTSYWADKSTGQKVLHGIAIALSGLGNAIAGKQGPNRALEIITGAIDRDMSTKLKAIDQKWRSVEDADKATEGTRQRWNDEVAATKMLYAGQYEAGADRIRASAERTKRPELIAKANEEAAKLEERAGALVQESEILHAADRGVTSGSKTRIVDGPPGGPAGGKLPTEGQAKNTYFAQQILDDLATLEKLPPLSQDAMKKIRDNEETLLATDKTAVSGFGGSMTARAGRALGAVPNDKYEGLTVEERQAAQAMDRINSNQLRIESGAVISDPEALRKARTGLPYAGDDKQAYAAKLQKTRQSAELLMRLAGQEGSVGTPAGVAYGTQPAPGQTPANPANDGVVMVRNKRTGETMPARRGPDGKLYPVQ